MVNRADPCSRRRSGPIRQTRISGIRLLCVEVPLRICRDHLRRWDSRVFRGRFALGYWRARSTASAAAFGIGAGPTSGRRPSPASATLLLPLSSFICCWPSRPSSAGRCSARRSRCVRPAAGDRRSRRRHPARPVAARPDFAADADAFSCRTSLRPPRRRSRSSASSSTCSSSAWS